ncbi:MAG: hypothetical protein GYA33_08385 [Thermogutta sp.]|nr:hypothetical protein [Thermogutta sp.]
MRDSMRKPPRRRPRIIIPQDGIPLSPCLLVWWNSADSLLMAGSGHSAQPVPSRRALQLLCERAAVVAVLGLPDQAAARYKVGEVCPPEKIRVVYGTTRSRFPAAGVRSLGPYLVRRRYFHEYDYPLDRLQMAARSQNSDLIACFQATPQGAFHEYWGIPLTSQAAELWAGVGDIFIGTLPSDINYIDFSRDLPKKTLSAIEGRRPKHKLSEFEKLIQAMVPAVKGNAGPARECGIRSLAEKMISRRAVRRLLPAAWSGTLDLGKELQRRTAVTSPSSMSDPRQWIWRGLLRGTLDEVNLAYLEACLGWVLGQLQHPELFPPANPLFDAPARQYFAETGFPSRKRKDSPPLKADEM